MNSIVRAWDKHHALKKPDVPDALTIDDVKVALGGNPMVQELRKVAINKGAVQELAVHGPVERVEALLRETQRTLVRLGVDPTKAKVLRKKVRFQGGRPGIHDIKRWLDDLRKPGETEGDEVTKQLNTDIQWLCRLHNTVKERSHPDVVKEVGA